MSTFLSENLNERESVFDGPVRLKGYSLTATGSKDRFVAFKDGDATRPMIVVPAGTEVSISGLDEPYPGGLSVESLTGDGKLVANVFYEVSPLAGGSPLPEGGPVLGGLPSP